MPACSVGASSRHAVDRAWLLPAEDVLSALGTDGETGLNEAEARRRLEQFGRNELEAVAPDPAWKRFAAQFRDVLVILLLVATAISLALWVRERDAALPYEALAIFAVVLLNAILGFTQEARAASAVAALRQIAAARARVVRDGVLRDVPAAEVVPGDVLAVEEGDTIPADARVLHSIMLQTAEAALTGESLPVTKTIAALAGDGEIGDRHNMVFSGTAATYGRGRAVVVSTGMQTEMGRIAGMLEAAPKETTPLQRELDHVGRLLGTIVVIIAVVMVSTIFIVEHVRGFAAFFDALIFGVALAVAAVPEGLPAVVTAVLSIGVQRAARRNAIVRHLSAVETLGSANVIASDKTGTLTRNEMTAQMLVTASGRIALRGSGYSPEGRLEREEGGAIDERLGAELHRAFVVAERANNASLQERDGRWMVQGDPTEGALLVAARKGGIGGPALDARLPRIAEVPFSSERKLMSTLHTDAESDGGLLVATKGAPDVLLSRCSSEYVGGVERPMGDDRRLAILRTNEGLTAESFRTLGLAYRALPERPADAAPVDESIEHEMVFVGLIGMVDPPRDEAADAVARTIAAGIRPIMITGDHPGTASVIARQLGIDAEGRAMTGAELSKVSDEELDRIVRSVSVYARVNPEHKLRIVKALQRGGACVAMTGDGVNDAPALKTADIGVAMGITGTDVAKEAADMVLADDNFATIVAAVEEGRAIYSNIRKFLRYLLSSNIGEVLTMFLGVVFADFLGLTRAHGGVVLPLLATQLLWINLVTDGAPALALGVDPADEGLMKRPPRPRSESVITRSMWKGIFLVGTVFAAGTLLVIDASLPGGLIEGNGTLAYAQTMAFTTMVLFSMFNLFNARSDDRSAFGGLFENRWLWGSVALSIALQIAVTYTPFLQQAFSTVPLTPMDWARCTVAASSVLWVREVSKLVRRGRPWGAR